MDERRRQDPDAPRRGPRAPDPTARNEETPTPEDTSRPVRWGREALLLLVGTVRQSLNDGVPNLAGALTYYALLSIFPALIVVVSLLAIVGQEATTRVLVDLMQQLLPEQAASAVEAPLEGVISDRAGLSALLSVGFVIAIWSASGYVGAFMWASRQMFEVEEGGSFLRNLARRIGYALGIMVLLAVLAVLLVASGPIVQFVGDALDIGDEALQLWAWLRWPLLLLAAALLFSILYTIAPDARRPGFHWLTLGGLLAVVLWLAVTLGFNFYVNQFADYSATYGALAGVIVFLFWLWLSNMAVLVGAELNSELARRRTLPSEAATSSAEEEQAA
jgi:membrane protein